MAQPRRELLTERTSLGGNLQGQLLTNKTEFNQVCQAIRAGSSVLVLGEYGSPKSELAGALRTELEDYSGAIASYQGSLKKLLVSIAQQLDIPTAEPRYNKDGEQVGEKALTADGLKEEITENVGDATLLILPESQRLPASIRYWLEELLYLGVKLIGFAVANPMKDVFLNLIEIELGLPTDAEIRAVMDRESKRLGLELSRSRLAELQSMSGRNLLLARKVIQEESLGINKRKPQHTQYVVIMPIIVACLMSFGIIRFVGMGTNNKALYIFGGASLVAGMTLKQLGSVRGARKQFGQ